MGFSGCHIPGHSGTQFRHRKAFVKNKSNKALKTLPNFVKNDSSFSAEKRDTYSDSVIVKILQKIVLPTLMVGSMFFIIICCTSFFRSLSLLSDGHSEYHQKARAKELQDWYRYFVKSGHYYMRTNNLEAAQNEIHRALKIFPTGMHANIAMTQILSRRCKMEGSFCSEAHHYYSLIDGKDSLDEQRFYEIKSNFGF